MDSGRRETKGWQKKKHGRKVKENKLYRAVRRITGRKGSGGFKKIKEGRNKKQYCARKEHERLTKGMIEIDKNKVKEKARKKEKEKKKRKGDKVFSLGSGKQVLSNKHR